MIFVTLILLMPQKSKRKSNGEKNRKNQESKKIRTDSYRCEPVTVVFVSLLSLTSIFNVFACPKCKKIGNFRTSFSKIKFLNFYLNINCNNCVWSYGSWLLPEKFNTAFQAAKTCTGIVETQMSRFLAMIGTSGTTEKRMPDFMHSSSTAKSLQDFVDQKIIDLAKKLIFAARNSLISEAQRKRSKTVDVAIDGCYNDTGHKRNSAQACIVSCVAKIRGRFKIIGNQCVKKPQEITDEQLESNGKGFIAPRGTSSSSLERIGVREVFEHTLLQIHHELPDAVIKIACDQDAKIRDPKNPNIFIDEERSNQLMIPMDHVAFVDDRAHISKNVHGTFQRHLKTGSSEMRFTAQQRLHLHSRTRRAIDVTMDKCSTGEWGIAEATAKMEKTRLHSYGDHSKCDSNCPQKPPILQPFGNFTLEMIKTQIDGFYAAHFGEKFIKSLVETGSSSPVEFFHALMIRRRLWVKGTYAGVLSLRYEVAGAMATLIYNEGQDKAFRMLHESINYAVPEAGLERIERYEQERKDHCEENQKKKSRVQDERRRKLKQYDNMGSYATQRQRDIDNSRRLFDEQKENQLPSFDELIAMEIEDFSEEEEEEDIVEG